MDMKVKLAKFVVHLLKVQYKDNVLHTIVLTVKNRRLRLVNMRDDFFRYVFRNISFVNNNLTN